MTTSSDGGAIRLGGLASGFDTEAIVEQLLASDQARIDNEREEKEINAAKIQTWEDVAEQLRLLSETVAKLKASGTLGDTLFDNKIVSSSSDTVASGIAVSNSLSGSYNLIVNNIARTQVVYGEQKADTFTVSSGSFVLNGTTITSDGGETLEELADKINASNYPLGEEIIANVIDNRLVIQTKNSGSDFSIYGTNATPPPFSLPSDDPDNILENELGIIDNTGNFNNIAQTSANADLTINGVPLTPSSNMISDAINGLTINLLSAGTTELSIKHDTEQVKSTISDFVDLYNETRSLISRIREAKLDEEDLFGLFSNDPLLRQLFNTIRSLTTLGVTCVNGDWEGSLATEAANINDSSITINGFDPAAANLYKGDSFVIPGHSQAYTLTNDANISSGSAVIDFYPPLENSISLGQITGPLVQTMEDFGVGTRTDTVSGIEGIIGIIDPAKLETALSSDMASIKRIFNRNHNEKQSHMGVARRLYDWIDAQIKISAFVNKTRSIEDIAIPGIEKKNEGIDDQIERLERSLEQKRRSLIRKFAEMENAISKTQSLGAAIGQISGSTGS